MTQNHHNAVIHLGHQNGTVTLWTPNLPEPAVRLLAHLGPVCSVSVDPSVAGRYMATAGQDGLVKVWDCRNWKGAVRQWAARSGSAEVEWSQRGCLAVASGGTVNVREVESLIFLQKLMRCIGIFATIYTFTIRGYIITTPLPHTSCTAPTSSVAPILPVSGSSYNRT